MSSSKQRIADLEVFAAEEGIVLPIPAATIAAPVASSAATVDLVTGAVIPGAADVRYHTTTLGEANVVVWRKGRQL